MQRRDVVFTSRTRKYKLIRKHRIVSIYDTGGSRNVIKQPDLRVNNTVT